jgi:hypothetical protein
MNVMWLRSGAENEIDGIDWSFCVPMQGPYVACCRRSARGGAGRRMAGRVGEAGFGNCLRLQALCSLGLQLRTQKREPPQPDRRQRGAALLMSPTEIAQNLVTYVSSAWPPMHCEGTWHSKRGIAMNWCDAYHRLTLEQHQVLPPF